VAGPGPHHGPAAIRESRRLRPPLADRVPSRSGDPCPGDLVGLTPPDQPPRLALVVEIKRGRAVLRQSDDRSAQERLVPLRDLWPLVVHPDRPDALLACAPLAPPLLAMAWQAADRTPAPTGWSLHQLVRLLYRDPTPEQVLALWLALAGPQDLFRLRRDGITVRSAADLKLLRQQRRHARRRRQGRQRCGR